MPPCRRHACGSTPARVIHRKSGCSPTNDRWRWRHELHVTSGRGKRGITGRTASSGRRAVTAVPAARLHDRLHRLRIRRAGPPRGRNARRRWIPGPLSDPEAGRRRADDLPVRGVEVCELPVTKYRGKKALAYAATYLWFLLAASFACVKLLIRRELDV